MTLLAFALGVIAVYVIYINWRLRKRFYQLERIMLGGIVSGGKRPFNVLHLLNAVRRQAQAWVPPAEDKYDNGYWPVSLLSSPSLNRQLDNYLENIAKTVCGDGKRISYSLEPSPSYDEIKIRNFVIVKLFDYEKIIPCLTQNEAGKIATFLMSKSIDARATQVLSNSDDTDA